MLKAIGEQVFSMWVNIADSLLSVILVWLLIPALDIFGYAVVIIIMELFNFILSFLRLKKRVSFRINLAHSLLLPLFSSSVAVYLTKHLFAISGRDAVGIWLVAEILFAISIFIALYRAFFPKAMP
jgi:O-antigen/teichoic acid export membrane protein